RLGGLAARSLGAASCRPKHAFARGARHLRSLAASTTLNRIGYSTHTPGDRRSSSPRVARSDGRVPRANHPAAASMDPGLASRIEAPKASIPKHTLDGIVANASTLSPVEVLARSALLMPPSREYAYASLHPESPERFAPDRPLAAARIRRREGA